MASIVAQWLQSLYNGFNRCTMASKVVQWLQRLYNGFNRCTMASIVVQWLQSLNGHSKIGVHFSRHSES